jgi:hypothetical protein
MQAEYVLYCTLYNVDCVTDIPLYLENTHTHTHTHTHLDNIFKARDGCLILWIILHEGAWINLNRCPACNKA